MTFKLLFCLIGVGTNPIENTLEDPLTEVIALESNPPVQDSAKEIFSFFFLKDDYFLI